MVEFNYQSTKKEMAQGGLISALTRTNQVVFKENEVKNSTVLWYTVLVQWEDFSQVGTSSSSTEISGRFQTVTWKVRLQCSCKHRVILWLNTGYTSCADIRHFTELQMNFCLFTLPYLFQSWFWTTEIELFAHLIDLYQHSLKNRSKLRNLHRTNRGRIIQVQWNNTKQKKKKGFLFRKTHLW